MKYLKITLATIIFVMSFAMQSNEVKAQNCPTGYSQKTVTVQINGCLYDIEVCYKCGSTAMETGVQVMSVTEVDANCSPYPSLIYSEIWEEVHDLVYDWNFIKQNICSGLTPSPCPDGLHYYVATYKCMQLFNMGGKIMIASCYLGDNYCVEGFIYCWDPELQQMIKIPNFGPTESTNYECPPNAEPFPGEPDFPNNPGEESPCFSVSSPCDE